ncbi:helix-turn-helix transcriptional regulator [Sphingobacterium corticibacterium]|uniref:AraC family transcriptional regulator n=1 Tax=Sphingobacterium corticibacterium TaxID=2484746 RepID=A0A4Q6XTH1_9SPHI|nr:AraC family transcriptional regulator [Sphingobacterium corticibacterium]RZF60089.1 AraC family transcriptional regulator [Sphingobacterium corticibacterium]
MSIFVLHRINLNKMENSCALTVTQYAFQHQYIKGSALFSYKTEQACYINILSHNCSRIVHYTLSHNACILPEGHNVIHYVDAYSTIEIRSEDACNHLVVVLIMPESLHFFHDKYQEESVRFAKGFVTKSDTRFRLLFEQLHSLSETDLLYQMRSELIILEIIFHQIQSLAVENKNTQHVIVMKGHYEKILLAKEIIEEDLSKNHSIPELAKQVGTNVQYLKKYFKQYFGKTVMNYITEKKMEHAKELILTGDHRVSDVARMTGYKHSTHFTTAFKRHFGFIPNSLKYSFLLQQGTDILIELEHIFGCL